MKRLILAFSLVAVGVVQASAAETPAMVDAERMKNADRDAANWLSYGRTYSEQRFSPLTKITSGQCQAARPGLVRGPRYQSRSGGYAIGYRRCDVLVDGMEHGQGVRRGDRQATLVIRSESCRASMASRPAATWSIAVSRRGTAKSM